MKGLTESQMSMVLWITIGVIILILILAAGIFFFYKIPFKGVI